MAKQTGRYLCSNATLDKTNRYLKELVDGSKKPGGHLATVLSEHNITNLNDIDAKDLIALLMNTREAQIFAESKPILNGSDWNSDETAILGDIVFSTTGTHAYNNGKHVTEYKHHKTPLDIHFLFIASALLANGHKTITSDMTEVTEGEDVNQDRLYDLYKRRLLPGLLIQNKQAQEDNVSLVINIPGLGCGQFAGKYEAKIRAALPVVLKKLFEDYRLQLDKIHAVNYDPYIKLEKDEFTTERKSDTRIKLMARPFTGLPESAPGSVASQLEFPKDGTDYNGFRLIKIVAWDHFSFPGNDLWQNKATKGNGRYTDDGVSLASSDVVLALFNMGQFKSDSPPVEMRYNEDQGIAYALKPTEDRVLGYKELSDTYPSYVDVNMIDVVNDSGEVLKPSDEEIKVFENNKKGIQDQFKRFLNEQLNPTGENTHLNPEIKKLHSTLLESQEDFFNKLTLTLTKRQLGAVITEFSKSCKKQIDIADKIMGHGWLYRTAEVLIKAVVGLFASAGMILGSLVGQGLVKSEHRQKFANTFFTLNLTDESQALDQFKQEIFGDGKEKPGLLSVSNLKKTEDTLNASPVKPTKSS